MIRFLLCDTDKEFLNKLASVLHQNFKPCSVEYLYGASTLKSFLCENTGEKYVLLTEIELGESNAISIIAKYLKDSSPLQIIYMTTKIEYCTEVYETRHCGFFLKPVQTNELLRNVHRAIYLLEFDQTKNIIVQHKNGVYILPPKSVLYVESKGRILEIVTDNEVFETYDKIDHFYVQLDKRFLRCHKSYLINMNHVKRYCTECFLMCNGVTIPISQSRRKEVRQEFLSYVGGEYL